MAAVCERLPREVSVCRPDCVVSMQEGPWATPLPTIYILLWVFKVYTILYSTSTWATTLPTIYQSLQAVLRMPAFMLQHSVQHNL